MVEEVFSSPTPFTPPTEEEDRLAWLRLIRSRRVGATTFFRLLREYGSAQAALAELPAIARAAGVDNYAPHSRGAADAEIAAARKAGAVMVCFGTPGYPPGLAALTDAPPVLWCRGDVTLLSRPMIALVGARNASSLGTRMATQLAAALGEAGFIVVSGLARGIDAAAHAAALPTGTVAVMAGGVDMIYPAENTALAARLAEAGTLLSEQPMGLDPQSRHFPPRNRIVSGLSRAVVVVEAAARSGSLITARDALDQGREVLAVPGHPFDARAAGCNGLIRDGATLIRGAADVLAAIGPAKAHPPAPSPDGARAPATDGRSAAPQARGGAKHAAPDTAHADCGRGLGTAAASGGPVRGRPSRAAPADPAPASRPPARRDADADADADRASPGDLQGRILERLGPSPLAEDQLIRDLALSAAQVAPELLALEIDGQIARQPGGLLARI